MMHSPESPVCLRCKSPIRKPEATYCPLCRYPLDNEREEQFIKDAINYLRPLVNAGGADLLLESIAALPDYALEDLKTIVRYGKKKTPSIGALFQQYQSRLNELTKEKTVSISPMSGGQVVSAQSSTTDEKTVSMSSAIDENVIERITKTPTQPLVGSSATSSNDPHSTAINPPPIPAHIVATPRPDPLSEMVPLPLFALDDDDVPLPTPPFKVAAEQSIPVQSATSMPQHVTPMPIVASTPAVVLRPDFPPSQPVYAYTPPSLWSKFGAGVGGLFQSFVDTSRTMLVDSPIMLLTSLASFFFLVLVLIYVFSTKDFFLNCAIVLVSQLAFGAGAIYTYRKEHFKDIARVYAGVCALLIVLLGIEGFFWLGGASQSNGLILSTVAAGYTGFAFCAFAIYQDYRPFGYFGVMAFVTTDLLTAYTLNLGFWWYPTMLMGLALLGLGSYMWLFADGAPLANLRGAISKYTTWIVVVCRISIGGIVLLLLAVDVPTLQPNPVVGLSAHQQEIRFALLVLLLLLVCWDNLYYRLAKREHGQLLTAFLFLACVLAFCYAFALPPVGYMLALLGVALVYHGLSRFAASRLRPELDLHLDQLALLLVAIIPFIVSPFLPVQVIASEYPFISAIDLHTQLNLSIRQIAALQSNWPTWAEAGAVILGCMLTVSIAQVRYNAVAMRRMGSMQRKTWPYLLLLSGFLLNWGYSLVVLLYGLPPLWAFASMTLALVVLAIGIRVRFGSSWANPVDIIVLIEAISTLLFSLSQQQSITGGLLLFFAALFYSVLLYQKRHSLFVCPLIFAFGALIVLPREVVFVLGVVLPLLAVFLHSRQESRRGDGLASPASVVSTGGRGQAIAPTGFPRNDAGPLQVLASIREWPLLVVGLVSGVLVSWQPLTLVPGIELTSAEMLAIFAGAWYVAAVLSRVRWWLLVALGLAVVAIVLPTNDFFVLAIVAFVAVVMGIGSSRIAASIWALPWYIVALCSAVMVGITGNAQGEQGLALWLLLGFALSAFIIACIERVPAWGWFATAFIFWSLIDVVLLQQFYLLPPVALFCTVAAFTISHLSDNTALPTHLLATRKVVLFRYAQPLYGAALIGAGLTGFYGLLVHDSFYFPFSSALMMVYAIVAFGITLYEKRPRWLLYVAGLALSGTVLAIATNIYSVFGVGIVAMLLAGIGSIVMKRVRGLPSLSIVLSISRRTRTTVSWSWPWYVTMLLASTATGIWAFGVTSLGASFSAYSLLIFALLSYIIGFYEDGSAWLWTATIYVAWAAVDAALINNFFLLPILTLVCAATGVVAGRGKRQIPSAGQPIVHSSGNRLLRYALPLYAASFAAALITGYYGLVVANIPFYGATPAALLVYALVAYSILLLENRPQWLWCVALLAVWSTLLARETTIGIVYGIGVLAGVGSVVMHRIKRVALYSVPLPIPGNTTLRITWSWPWYATMLVASIVTSWQALAFPHVGATFSAYSLLTFALLTYGIGISEDQMAWLWTTTVYVVLAGSNAVIARDFYLLTAIVLVTVLGGVVVGHLPRTWRTYRGSRDRLLSYALPLYVAAFGVALLTGFYGMSVGIEPFYGAVPAALLCYGVIAYGIVLWERRSYGLWAVAALAVWGTLLATRTTIYVVFGIGILAVALAALGNAWLKSGKRVYKQTGQPGQPGASITPRGNSASTVVGWSWPWYVTMLVASTLTGIWAFGLTSLGATFAAYSLLIFALLSYLIGLYEQQPLWLWTAAVFVAWSALDAALVRNFYLLPVVALLSMGIGVVVSTRLHRSIAHPQNWHKFHYALPLYCAALTVFIITGGYTLILPNAPFYGVGIGVMLVYTLIAQGVWLIERQSWWLWCVAGLAVWSVFLTTQTNALITIAVGLGAGGLGMLLRTQRLS